MRRERLGGWADRDIRRFAARAYGESVDARARDVGPGKQPGVGGRVVRIGAGNDQRIARSQQANNGVARGVGYRDVAVLPIATEVAHQQGDRVNACGKRRWWGESCAAAVVEDDQRLASAVRDDDVRSFSRR